MNWFEIKQWLSIASGLNMDALHVHAGVLGQILAALMLRRSLASPWPWFAVLAFVLGNEYYDYHHEIWPNMRFEQRAEGIRDTWNTMLVPSLLFLLARFLPRLMRPDPLPPPAADERSADPG